MEIRLDQLKKLESSSLSTPLTRSEKDVLEVIVKVRKEDYTPKGIQVRAQIDPCLFTCEIPAKTLESLEQDPDVVSIAIGKRLRVIE